MAVGDEKTVATRGTVAKKYLEHLDEVKQKNGLVVSDPKATSLAVKPASKWKVETNADRVKRLAEAGQKSLNASSSVEAPVFGANAPVRSPVSALKKSFQR